MEPIKINNYTKSKSRANTSSFVANVFSLMFTALIISGISAVWFASEEMKHYIISYGENKIIFAKTKRTT